MLDKELASQLTDAEKDHIEQVYLEIFPSLVNNYNYSEIKAATKEIVDALAKTTISLRSENSL